MKRLGIFDLDGTLLDTVADLAAAVNHALRGMGFPAHDVDTIRTFVGNGVGKLQERALPEGERTGENLARMRAAFLPYYDAHNADLSRPYPGVEAVLEELQRRGLMLAVASNKYQAATERLVAHFFPTVRFVRVLGQREDVPVKPHPAIVLDIMKTAGVETAEVLYVGDSGVDMQTARNAGVDAVGVAWGFRPRQELEAFAPLAVIDKAEELVLQETLNTEYR